MPPENPGVDLSRNRLDVFSARIDQEINTAKRLIERRDAGEKIEDFDIRGDLYASAMELAPDARQDDIVTMRDILHLRGDENVVDLAAGGGFLTKKIRQWTKGDVIAVDPAHQQLQHLEKAVKGDVRIIVGSPDDHQTMEMIDDGSVDVVTSFGGLHHVSDQRAMMVEISRILKPKGRFVAGDVGGDTPLSRHFDEVTAVKSLTGHTAIWLSKERLEELVEGLGLNVRNVDDKVQKWVYDSEREMALFFRGLHAYDQPDEEILTDLKNVLGYEKRDGKVYLNWPMIFFEIIKE